MKSSAASGQMPYKERPAPDNHLRPVSSINYHSGGGYEKRWRQIDFIGTKLHPRLK